MSVPQLLPARNTGPSSTTFTAPLWAAEADTPARRSALAEIDAPDEPSNPPEWTEQDVVLLHWRLLQEIAALPDPDAPLESKLDTLHWVFTERDKDARPFSFVNCLKVVGCSPLSPIAYYGAVDAEEIREHVRRATPRWLQATLARYPTWVRDEVSRNPQWVERQLARNPQWLNEQLRSEQVRISARQGDLFA